METIFCIGCLNYDYYQLPTAEFAYLGGSTTNTAYFLSTLLEHTQFKVELASLIGTDVQGQQVENLLIKKTFGHGYVKKWEGHTGSTMITLDKKGERTIIRLPSVISNLPQYIRDSKMIQILHGQKIHLKGSLEL